MYVLIARTASIILVALMLQAIASSWLPSSARFPKRFWGWSMRKRIFFFIAVVFFLMLVIEWASQHQRAE
jgi:uncharacterized membrane protein